jgi:aspartate carbamoyltransferase catalytic subunit
MTTIQLAHLLGIEGMDAATLGGILDLAGHFKRVNQRKLKKVPALRGVMVLNFFVEDSTRTRLSFETAEKRLSADTLNFSASTSSIKKGETLVDTIPSPTSRPWRPTSWSSATGPRARRSCCAATSTRPS